MAVCGAPEIVESPKKHAELLVLTAQSFIDSVVIFSIVFSLFLVAVSFLVLYNCF